MNKINYVSIEQLKKFKEFCDKQEGQKHPCSNQIVKCGIITKDRDLAIDYIETKKRIANVRLIHKQKKYV